jgi:hypothetical protein
MKKALAVLAMTLMIIGLTGCMDDPDGSKQNTEKKTMQNN